MEKLLSVAVPSYNAVWCLGKCLDSFLETPVRDKLEIIIVNDGSTDDTLKLAKEYTERYPDIFRILNKENGGHGSGINAAIRIATGLFFKVVDADDWIISENLESFLKVLENTEADVIINHFHTVDMLSGEKREYKTRGIPLNKLYTLEEFVSYTGDIYPCAVFHGLTYRTQIYRDSGAVLSEGIFYEDHEYATLPFVKVKTVLLLDMFLYQYLVGNANQSVADANQVKRIHHVEQVVRRLFECYHSSSDLSVATQRYIARKATDLLFVYYQVSMIKNLDKRSGRQAANRLKKDLQDLEPGLIATTNRRYELVRFMSLMGCSPKILEQLKHPIPYEVYRKLFRKNKR